MSVAKVIEILAEGENLEEATQEAVNQASKSVSDIKNVYVESFQAIVENGSITKYRVNAKVTFVVRN